MANVQPDIVVMVMAVIIISGVVRAIVVHRVKNGRPVQRVPYHVPPNVALLKRPILIKMVIVLSACSMPNV